MANIQKRKTQKGDVSYRVQIRLSGYPQATKTFDRLTDAKAWAAQTETAMRERKHFPNREAERHTLNDLADRYIKKVERDNPGAAPKQAQIMRWWQKQLGDYALANITTAMITEKRDSLLDEGYSAATTNRYLAALRKAMNDEVSKQDWMRDNPVSRVEKQQEPRGRVRFLSKDDELPRLLAACRKSALPELYMIVRLAITSGMRKGEILGLRWADVDLARGQATIQDTKNDERRAVTLVPEVVALLKEHSKVRRLNTDLVFVRQGKDKAVVIDTRFREAVAKAKIKDFHFHDLRHTCASFLAMSGATIPELADVLGHKTLSMVQRYAHLSQAHTSSVVERMNKKFLGAV